METRKNRWGMRLAVTISLLLCLTVLLGEVARGAPITDPDFVGTILNPADLQKYVTPLPNAYLLQIAPDTTTFPGEDYYKVDMGQFNHDMQLVLNPAAVASYPAALAGKLPPTPSWGYSLVPPSVGTPGTYYFPGPTIVNTQGRPTRVTWTNSLPPIHVLSMDPTLVCGPPTTTGSVNGPLSPLANNAPNCAPENRVVVHTHGAHVWDDSDGDPLAWFGNNFAVTGETWKPNTQHGPVGTYRYINDQEAGTIWYHDHAMGLTHLNVYAGLAGFFLITDANETNLRNTGVLPRYTAAAPYEIPIALQERKFYPDGRLAVPDNPVLDDTAQIGAGIPCDATPGAFAPYACLPAVGGVIPNAILPATTLCDPAAVNVALYGCPAAKFSKAADGSLIPYNPAIAAPGQPGPFTAPSITPEFFGNVSIVNGITWPVNSTEQRKYRLRLLNGNDSRTYFLKFEPTVQPNPPINIPVWQIGTDQAFLDKPVDRTGQFIILMPGERIDLIVDFAVAPIGTRVLLTNYGPMATVNGLPAGPNNPLFDIPYDGVKPLPGQPLNLTIPDVMAFDVIAKNPATPDATITLNTQLRPVPSFTTYPSITPTTGAPGSAGVPSRKLALIERQGTHGRFMLTIDGRDFMDPNSPVTDLPKLGDIEEWEIANLTPDAHPMHLHLVAFQLINRQEISVDPASPTTIYNNAAGLPPFTRWPLMPYKATPSYIYNMQDPAAAPDYPPLLPLVASVPVPPDPWEIGWKDTIQTLPGTVTRLRAKFDLPGLYVWHCHILSHEENDMMRPMIVTTPAASVTATLSRNGAALGAGEPAATATPITITAQGKTGLTGPAIYAPQDSNGFEYQFSVNGVVVQPFTAWMYPMLESFTWTPPTTAPGTYTIRVDARQASSGTAGASQANFTTTYKLQGPEISGASSTTPAGAYKAGSVINVTLSFNQAVTSAGLAITLNNGLVLNTGALAGVNSYSGSFTLATGQDTPAGKYLDVISIIGTIKDAAANSNSILTVPAGANISNSVAITTDTTLPVSKSTTPPGTYSGSVNIVLVSSEAGSIYYTTDGSVPTLASPRYIGPIALSSPTTTTVTVNFFAVDLAGNVEAATNSALYNLHTADLTAKVAINNGKLYTNSVNVMVSLSASDKAGVTAYAISTDNITYQQTVPISPSVAVFSANNLPVTLPSGDGLKTVYVKFTDAMGVVYPPVSAQITLETMLPVVTYTPSPGDYAGKLMVALSTPNEPEGATIYYTTNGSTPSLASPIYRAPFTIGAPGTTIVVKFFAADYAGNIGTVQSATYRFVANPDMSTDLYINNEAKYTNTRNVTLRIKASDPVGGGVGTMSFSNDGVNFTVPVPYVANNAMPWMLDPGDGLKTVYFRFTDKGTTGVAPIAYTFTKSIFLAEGVVLATGDCNGDGKVDLVDVVKAMLGSAGLKKLTPQEQARCDVGPLVSGRPLPDGKIDVGDALLITKKSIGLISF